MCGSTYGCTKLRCGTVLSVEDNSNSNILLSSTLHTKVPPPPKFTSCKYATFNQSVTLEYDNRVTGNYNCDEDSVILNHL